MTQLIIHIDDYPYYFTYEEVAAMKKFIEMGAVIFLTNTHIIDYCYYFTLINFLDSERVREPRRPRKTTDVSFDILEPSSFELYIRKFFANRHLSYPQTSSSTVDFLDAVYEEVNLNELLSEFHQGIIETYRDDQNLVTRFRDY